MLPRLLNILHTVAPETFLAQPPNAFMVGRTAGVERLDLSEKESKDGHTKEHLVEYAELKLKEMRNLLRMEDGKVIRFGRIQRVCCSLI